MSEPYMRPKVLQASVFADGSTVSSQHDPFQNNGNIAEASAGIAYAIDPKTQMRQELHALTGDSIVSINGCTLTVNQARTMGWLPAEGKSAAHPNDAVSPQEETNAEQRTEEHDDLKMEAFANEADDIALTSIIESTSGLDQIIAIKEIIETGDVSPNVLNSMASTMGMEPDALRSKFAPVLQAFESQARSVMSQGGVDADDVIAYAQQHRPKELLAAMNSQAMYRKTAGYASLREDYLADLGEKDPEVALAANLTNGFTSYKDDRGRVIVRTPEGATMTWKSAIKSYLTRQ